MHTDSTGSGSTRSYKAPQGTKQRRSKSETDDVRASKQVRFKTEPSSPKRIPTRSKAATLAAPLWSQGNVSTALPFETFGMVAGSSLSSTSTHSSPMNYEPYSGEEVKPDHFLELKAFESKPSRNNIAPVEQWLEVAPFISVYPALCSAVGTFFLELDYREACYLNKIKPGAREKSFFQKKIKAGCLLKPANYLLDAVRMLEDECKSSKKEPAHKITQNDWPKLIANWQTLSGWHLQTIKKNLILLKRALNDNSPLSPNNDHHRLIIQLANRCKREGIETHIVDLVMGIPVPVNESELKSIPAPLQASKPELPSKILFGADWKGWLGELCKEDSAPHDKVSKLVWSIANNFVSIWPRNDECKLDTEFNVGEGDMMNSEYNYYSLLLAFGHESALSDTEKETLALLIDSGFWHQKTTLMIGDKIVDWRDWLQLFQPGLHSLHHGMTIPDDYQFVRDGVIKSRIKSEPESESPLSPALVSAAGHHEPMEVTSEADTQTELSCGVDSLFKAVGAGKDIATQAVPDVMDTTTLTDKDYRQAQSIQTDVTIPPDQSYASKGVQTFIPGKDKSTQTNRIEKKDAETEASFNVLYWSELFTRDPSLGEDRGEQIARFETCIVNKNSEIETLKEDIEALKKRFLVAQKELGDLESNNADIDEKRIHFKKESEILEERLSDLEDKYENMKSYAEKLEKDIESKDQSQALTSEIMELTRKNAELQSKCDSFEAQTQQLEKTLRLERSRASILDEELKGTTTAKQEQIRVLEETQSRLAQFISLSEALKADVEELNEQVPKKIDDSLEDKKRELESLKETLDSYHNHQEELITEISRLKHKKDNIDLTISILEASFGCIDDQEVICNRIRSLQEENTALKESTATSEQLYQEEKRQLTDKLAQVEQLKANFEQQSQAVQRSIDTITSDFQSQLSAQGLSVTSSQLSEQRTSQVLKVQQEEWRQKEEQYKAESFRLRTELSQLQVGAQAQLRPVSYPHSSLSSTPAPYTPGGILPASPVSLSQQKFLLTGMSQRPVMTPHETLPGCSVTFTRSNVTETVQPRQLAERQADDPAAIQTLLKECDQILKSISQTIKEQSESERAKEGNYKRRMDKRHTDINLEWMSIYTRLTQLKQSPVPSMSILSRIRNQLTTMSTGLQNFR